MDKKKKQSGGRWLPFNLQIYSIFICLADDHHCLSSRVLCSPTCSEMSSRTWNFPGEFRGRRWARRCSTEISPWTDGKSFSLRTHYFQGADKDGFIPKKWVSAMNGLPYRESHLWSETGYCELQPSSRRIHREWSNNLKKISLVWISASLTPSVLLSLSYTARAAQS